MDVAQVLGERSQWDTCMPVFANLLRASMSADPVVEIWGPDGAAVNEDITRFRDSGEGESLKNWGDQLVSLVFDGYVDWAAYYSAHPEWVLTNLAQVLEDAAQQAALLGHLYSIADAMPETRGECLVRFKNDIDRWGAQWQYNASLELDGAQGPLPQGQERVEAYPNTDNWNYSRTPGTYYYKYLERAGSYVYVYNDDADADDEHWHEARYWDEQAEALAGRYENRLTVKYPAWDSSWAAWSVLENPNAAGGLVFGTAEEGRWYDYDGAVQAHDAQLREAQAAAQVHAVGAATVDSPLLAFTREIRDEVLVPLTEQIMRSLPPETAGKPGIDVLVRQYVRADISRRTAALAASAEGGFAS
jgi:hypothetical protein